MTLNLRDHFDRAVSDDPGATPATMAAAAIADGGRVRRRRHLRAAAGAAAGVAVMIGAFAGLGLSHRTPDSPPPVTLAAAMMPVTAPSCLPHPVESDATDVMIFLTAGATETQRAALGTALRDDPRVTAPAFEDREQAYRRFRAHHAGNPDLVAAVSADRFPASWRLRLADAGEYTAVRARYVTMDGVEQVTGRRCTADAPVGGTL